MNRQLYRTIALVAPGMLLLALLPMPYGYYQLLRLAVTVAACLGAYRAYNRSETGWAVGMGIVALLFNPVFPVHLSRGVWAPINIIVAVTFWISNSTLAAVTQEEDQPDTTTSG